MTRVTTLALAATFGVLLLRPTPAQDEAPGPESLPPFQAARHGAGPGPRMLDGGRLELLADALPGQSNSIGFERAAEEARDRLTLSCRLRVLEGGDGGAFLFLDTAEHGVRGPAPFVPCWAEPNVKGAFAVGIDVHDPPNGEPFGPWGNYQGLPEREVSLHLDGREVVKRVAEQEFRGDWTALRIDVRHVCGGAEVTVEIGESAVYDAYFLPELQPFEARLAIGAGTRADATTRFDVEDLVLTAGAPSAKTRPPLHVEVFHHVRTDGARQSFEREVDLPPPEWAFGRVLLTLDLHDAGEGWDEWDRNGHLYVVDPEGVKRDIVPFITSYRTECHWVVDVTHFRPWLAGKTRFEIAAGTNFYKNRGYLMSVSLDFHHGTPKLGETAAEPFRVVPLWHGIARHRGAGAGFSEFFEPQAVPIPEGTTGARIATTTTGHSQVGEFTPSRRTIVVRTEAEDGPREERFPNLLWKTDCYLNPNRPQFGTWKYSRAGWAPGDVVRPWWIDLDGIVVPGRELRVEYVPEPYDLSEVPEDRRPGEAELDRATHVVRSYLTLYREPAGLVAAPVLRVTSVAAGSAAEKAGILAGDWIASYDGRTVDTFEELSAAKQAAADAGKKTVTIVVYRGLERRELPLGTGQIGVSLSGR